MSNTKTGERGNFFSRKPAVPKASGTVVRDLHLTQVNDLGEYTVVAIAGPTGTKQFTISRPIGITDLDKKADWIITPTGEVQGALAKVKDPSQGEINQRRQQLLTAGLVEAKLLEKVEEGGKAIFRYPGQTEGSRNGALKEADADLKAKKAEIRGELPADPTKAEKGQVKMKLDRLKRIDFLKKDFVSAEKAIIDYMNRVDVQERLAEEVPQTYFTPVGPYGTERQQAMPWAKGKTLATVSDEFSKLILELGRGTRHAGSAGAAMSTSAGWSSVVADSSSSSGKKAKKKK